MASPSLPRATDSVISSRSPNPDEHPTVLCDRRIVFGAEAVTEPSPWDPEAFEPTQLVRPAPDYDPLEAHIPTVKTRRRPRRTQPLLNRDTLTPIAPARSRLPRRELPVERPKRHSQLSIEPPTDVTEVTEVGARGETTAPAPLALSTEAVLPAAVPEVIVQWTLLDEYGWWSAGAVVGALLGSAVVAGCVAAVVLNGGIAI